LLFTLAPNNKKPLPEVSFQQRLLLRVMKSLGNVAGSFCCLRLTAISGISQLFQPAPGV
jgi:hypothetical protein